MSVNPTNARKRQHEGKSFYFCSERCARKFDADPTKYVSGKAHAAGSSAEHSCCQGADKA